MCCDRGECLHDGGTSQNLGHIGHTVRILLSRMGRGSSGEEVILGMDFMALAGIRLDMADGT